MIKHKYTLQTSILVKDLGFYLSLPLPTQQLFIYFIH